MFGRWLRSLVARDHRSGKRISSADLVGLSVDPDTATPALSPVVPDVQVYISNLTFSDGTKVDLERNTVFVLTGPNNVGKSSVLKEIRDFMLKGRAPGPVLRNIEISRVGSKEDFRHLIERSGILNKRGDSVLLDYGEYKLSNVNDDYERGFVGRDPMNFFMSFLSATERLGLTDPMRKGDYSSRSPKEPLQWLEFDEEAEERLRFIFQNTFDLNLVLNPLAGEKISLHVSKIGDQPNGPDAKSFISWIRSQSPLEQQGDGMRSFTGTLISLLVHPRQIILLDEPEAFLHPPQARRLAEVFTSIGNSRSQVITATHSDEIVRAIIDSSAENTIFCRISRRENQNRVSLIRSEDAKIFWADPILRTSDVISALFYEIAILCEAETDARFYRALLKSTFGSSRDPDFRFFHFGGKGKIPIVAKALRTLDVPTIGIVDVDALSDIGSFKRIYESYQLSLSETHGLCESAEG